MKEYLIHYGIKGMKWGVRKQYEGTGGGGGGGWGPNTVAGGGGPSPLAASMAGNLKKKTRFGKNEVKKMGIEPGPEPEGYSAKRQRKEDKLKSAIKNATSSKEKMALQKEYNAYRQESKNKAKEYLKWEKAVKQKVGNTKNYVPIKVGEKYTGEWMNKHSGKIISDKEYWTAGEYDTLPFFKKVFG